MGTTPEGGPGRLSAGADEGGLYAQKPAIQCVRGKRGFRPGLGEIDIQFSRSADGRDGYAPYMSAGRVSGLSDRHSSTATRGTGGDRYVRALIVVR